MRLNLVCLIANIGAHCAAPTALTDLECPDHFQLQQDHALRLFRVLDDTNCLGTILNSDFGIFEFYDDQRQKYWTNRFDTLYDTEERSLAHVHIAYRGFCNPSPPVELFSATADLLMVLQAEGDGKCFVFRDGESQQPLAIALWSWVPAENAWSRWLGTGWPNWVRYDYYVQNWEIMVVYRKRLQERSLSNVFLIWALLKHAQQYFPDPQRIGYQSMLPDQLL